MSITRPRRSRILEKAGLRYIAGWIGEDDAAPVAEKIESAKARVMEALKDES